jgi:hypothetical protein
MFKCDATINMGLDKSHADFRGTTLGDGVAVGNSPMRYDIVAAASKILGR